MHYWLYTPGQGAEKWKECCDREVMLLGWGKIGDLEILNTKDEIKQQLKQVYGNESSYINLSNTLWQFAHDIKIGDNNKISNMDKIFDVKFDLNKENSNGLGLYIVSNILNNYNMEYKALQNEEFFIFKIKIFS